MKRLGLLRHAKSDWDDGAVRDFDRGLNARGRRGAALMGHHIAERGDVWPLIVASPAERVRATLAESGLPGAVQWDTTAYLAAADTLLRIVRGLPDAQPAVLIAGHNPGLHDLLAMLADDGAGRSAAADKFPTAGYAVVTLAIERWAECAPDSGQLSHFARPGDLDPALGPRC